jgi:phytoene dehydrogenase-like protein
MLCILAPPGTAEMAYMFLERNSGHSTIDYPLGGSRAIVDALVRGGWR